MRLPTSRIPSIAPLNYEENYIMNLTSETVATKKLF